MRVTSEIEAMKAASHRLNVELALATTRRLLISPQVDPVVRESIRGDVESLILAAREWLATRSNKEAA